MSSQTQRQLAVLVALTGLVVAPARALDRVASDGTVASPSRQGFDAQGTEQLAAETAVTTFEAHLADPLLAILDATPSADPDRLGWDVQLTNTAAAAAIGMSLDGDIDRDPGDLAFPFDCSHAASDSQSSQTMQPDTRAVPRPQPALLTGLGLVGLAFYGRRR